ncbi:cytochrome P450 4c21-like [Brevipalpus obovatus]|uniref:cytochrome P450 4c21-like n=1 Tax=Brevipalpus obovatus TaxID=246614 RepID=UPI003D9DF230
MDPYPNFYSLSTQINYQLNKFLHSKFMITLLIILGKDFGEDYLQADIKIQDKTTEILETWIDEFRSKDGFFVFWFYYWPTVMCVSYKTVEKILGNKIFLDRGEIARMFFGDFQGIICITGAKWKSRRNLMAPSYTSSVIESFASTILEFSQKLIDDVENAKGSEIKIVDLIDNRLMDIVLETSMGLKDQLDVQGRQNMVTAINGFVGTQCDKYVKVYLQNEFICKIYYFLNGIIDQRKNVRRYCIDIIKTRINQLSDVYHERLVDGQKEKQAFLDMMVISLLQRTDGNPEEFEINDLMMDVMNVIGAGYDTTASSIKFFLHILAHHPDIQDKLYQELIDFDENNEMVTIAQLNELKFLDQCIKETMRIYPPVAMMSRRASNDVKLGNYIVPKDSEILTSIYAIHRDPNVWEDPLEFKPSRFEPDNLANIPNGAYIPFGDGPRRCIGERLAMFELKLILINIVKNFKIASDDPKKLQLTLYFLTKPDKPLSLKFVSRSKKTEAFR